MGGFNSIKDWFEFVKNAALSYDSTLHFYAGELQDIINASRNSYIFPLVFCEGFTASYPEPKKKEYNVTVSVLDVYKEVQDRSSIINAIASCEIKGDNILRIMREQSRNKDCLFSISNVNAEPVMHDQERIAGISYSFTVTQFFRSHV